MRTRVTAALLVMCTALALSAGPARAQDYPGGPAAPVCTASISFSAPALPGATLTVTITCGSLVVGSSQVGSLNSTPVPLTPAAVVSSGHSVSYSGIKLPADWETNARHTATLTDASTGRLTANIPFYVDSKGKVTASAPTATTLARTGSSNHTGDVAKSGVVLLAAGAAAVAISRKRHQRTAAAA